MNMQFKSNWSETRQRFTAWWNGESTGRPLINLMARRETPLINPHEVIPFENVEDRCLNLQKALAHQIDYYCNYEPVAEAFPGISLDIGAGSLALYLGCEPYFGVDSVWFEPTMKENENYHSIRFDRNNYWYKLHIGMFRKAKEIIKDTDALLCIPDIVEHIDILASLRGTTNLCYDFYDHPEQVRKACEKLNEYYKICFDKFNAYCIDETVGNAFTAFAIWGQSRTAKIQCDMAAILSEETFRDFALEPLREQCIWLNHSMFHLDGPECIIHVPALMEIDELNALQWTTGNGNPPAGEECWFDLYKMVKDAGKGLWLAFHEYSPDVAIDKADKLVKKFGADGFFFFIPPMSQGDADKFLLKAEREWKC